MWHRGLISSHGRAPAKRCWREVTDLLTGVFGGVRTHTHLFSFNSLLQRVHQKALNPSRAHPPSPPPPPPPPLHLLFFFIPPVQPRCRFFSLCLDKHSAAAAGLLLSLAKDNGGAAGDGDDDEGWRRRRRRRRWRRRRRGRGGFILLSDLWSGWQQDGPFFVVFVCVCGRGLWLSKKIKAVPKSKSE